MSSDSVAPVVDPVILTVRQIANRLAGKLRPLLEDAEGLSREDEMYAVVRAAVTECLESLNALNLWGQANRHPSSEIWNVAGPILMHGWMQHRAWRKPRGYAGDYEMLRRIHDNQLCDNPFGRLLDRFFQDEAAPQAVRNRMRMVSDWIVQRVRRSNDSCRVVSFGSGPGLDVAAAAGQLTESERERLEVRLLDIDPAAVEFGVAGLRPLLKPSQIQGFAGNLFRVPRSEKMAGWLDGADLIFCTGMFDYFDDALSAEMIRVLWNCLAAGGQLWIFNFSPKNPSRAFMEWLGNWYLIYRDEEQMQSLASVAGLPGGSWQVGAEPLGVDLYVSAFKA
jgi:hypothetical protein